MGFNSGFKGLNNFANAPKRAGDGYLLWPKHVIVLKRIKYIYIYTECATD